MTDRSRFSTDRYWTDRNLLDYVRTSYYSPPHAAPDLEEAEAELAKRGLDPERGYVFDFDGTSICAAAELLRCERRMIGNSSIGNGAVMAVLFRGTELEFSIPESEWVCPRTNFRRIAKELHAGVGGRE